MHRRFITLAALAALAIGGCSFSSGNSSSKSTKCYAGDWVATDATMRSMLGVADEPEAPLTGAVALTLGKNGDFAYAFEDLGTNTTSEGKGAEISITGTVSGTYKESGDAFVFTLEKNDVMITANGRTQKGDIKLGSNDKGNGTVGETPYTCSGNSLSLTGSNDGKVTTWTRA